MGEPHPLGAPSNEQEDAVVAASVDQAAEQEHHGHSAAQHGAQPEQDVQMDDARSTADPPPPPRSNSDVSDSSDVPPRPLVHLIEDDLSLAPQPGLEIPDEGLLRFIMAILIALCTLPPVLSIVEQYYHYCIRHRCKPSCFVALFLETSAWITQAGQNGVLASMPSVLVGLWLGKLRSWDDDPSSSSSSNQGSSEDDTVKDRLTNADLGRYLYCFLEELRAESGGDESFVAALFDGSLARRTACPDCSDSAKGVFTVPFPLYLEAFKSQTGVDLKDILYEQFTARPAAPSMKCSCPQDPLHPVLHPGSSIGSPPPPVLAFRLVSSLDQELDQHHDPTLSNRRDTLCWSDIRTGSSSPSGYLATPEELEYHLFAWISVNDDGIATSASLITSPDGQETWLLYDSQTGETSISDSPPPQPKPGLVLFLADDPAWRPMIEGTTTHNPFDAWATDPSTHKTNAKAQQQQQQARTVLTREQEFAAAQADEAAKFFKEQMEGVELEAKLAASGRGKRQLEDLKEDRKTSPQQKQQRRKNKQKATKRQVDRGSPEIVYIGDDPASASATAAAAATALSPAARRQPNTSPLPDLRPRVQVAHRLAPFGPASICAAEDCTNTDCQISCNVPRWIVTTLVDHGALRVEESFYHARHLPSSALPLSSNGPRSTDDAVKGWPEEHCSEPLRLVLDKVIATCESHRKQLQNLPPDDDDDDDASASANQDDSESETDDSLQDVGLWSSSNLQRLPWISLKAKLRTLARSLGDEEVANLTSARDRPTLLRELRQYSRAWRYELQRESDAGEQTGDLDHPSGASPRRDTSPRASKAGSMDLEADEMDIDSDRDLPRRLSSKEKGKGKALADDHDEQHHPDDEQYHPDDLDDHVQSAIAASYQQPRHQPSPPLDLGSRPKAPLPARPPPPGPATSAAPLPPLPLPSQPRPASAVAHQPAYPPSSAATFPSLSRTSGAPSSAGPTATAASTSVAGAVPTAATNLLPQPYTPSDLGAQLGITADPHSISDKAWRGLARAYEVLGPAHLATFTGEEHLQRIATLNLLDLEALDKDELEALWPEKLSEEEEEAEKVRQRQEQARNRRREPYIAGLYGNSPLGEPALQPASLPPPEHWMDPQTGLAYDTSKRFVVPPSFVKGTRVPAAGACCPIAAAREYTGNIEPDPKAGNTLRQEVCDLLEQLDPLRHIPLHLLDDVWDDKTKRFFTHDDERMEGTKGSSKQDRATWPEYITAQRKETTRFSMLELYLLAEVLGVVVQVTNVDSLNSLAVFRYLPPTKPRRSTALSPRPEVDQHQSIAMINAGGHFTDLVTEAAVSNARRLTPRAWRFVPSDCCPYGDSPFNPNPHPPGTSSYLWYYGISDDLLTTKADLAEELTIISNVAKETGDETERFGAQITSQILAVRERRRGVQA